MDAALMELYFKELKLFYILKNQNDSSQTKYFPL